MFEEVREMRLAAEWFRLICHWKGTKVEEKKKTHYNDIVGRLRRRIRRQKKGEEVESGRSGCSVTLENQDKAYYREQKTCKHSERVHRQVNRPESASGDRQLEPVPSHPRRQKRSVLK